MAAELSVRQLKELLQSLKIDITGCVEKTDLIVLVLKANNGAGCLELAETASGADLAGADRFELAAVPAPMRDMDDAERTARIHQDLRSWMGSVFRVPSPWVSIGDGHTGM